MPAELSHVYSVLREWCAANVGKTPKSIKVTFEDDDHLRLPIPAALVRATHSPDFRSANWYGQEFSFTLTQATCLKTLWEAWENGCPEMSGQTILEAIESPQNRLDYLFKDHPAWGTMIVCGETRGTYRLGKKNQNS